MFQLLRDFFSKLIQSTPRMLQASFHEEQGPGSDYGKSAPARLLPLVNKLVAA